MSEAMKNMNRDAAIDAVERTQKALFAWAYAESGPPYAEIRVPRTALSTMGFDLDAAIKALKAAEAPAPPRPQGGRPPMIAVSPFHQWPPETSGSELPKSGSPLVSDDTTSVAQPTQVAAPSPLVPHSGWRSRWWRRSR